MSGGYRDWAGLTWRLHWGLHNIPVHILTKKIPTVAKILRNTQFSHQQSHKHALGSMHLSSHSLPSSLGCIPAFSPPSALNNGRWWVGGEAGRPPVQAAQFHPCLAWEVLHSRQLHQSGVNWDGWFPTEVPRTLWWMLALLAALDVG